MYNYYDQSQLKAVVIPLIQYKQLEDTRVVFLPCLTNPVSIILQKKKKIWQQFSLLSFKMYEMQYLRSDCLHLSRRLHTVYYSIAHEESRGVNICTGYFFLIYTDLFKKGP